MRGCPTRLPNIPCKTRLPILNISLAIFVFTLRQRFPPKMDPLSALAIAAAVFQFLELGGKLCIKGWEKYKQIQQTIPDDQKLAQKEEELRKIFEDLSGQISWFRQVSTSIVVSQHPTPTQAQLLKLSSQCASLASDFERIKSQMKLPNNRAIKSARRKDLKNAEVQRNKEEIEPIKKCLKLLKQETMDFILLSLWYVYSMRPCPL